MGDRLTGIDAAFDNAQANDPRYQAFMPKIETILGAVPSDELQDWWMDSARREIEPMIGKMQEYGGKGRAQDLVDVGRRMFEAGVKLPGGEYHPDATDAQFIELTIYFYVIGKIGRWTAAINEGRPVSDDTLHDIIVYTKMLQRVREVGGWPV